MVLSTTLCGDWAGQASILEQTCGALSGTNTCYTQYVIDDASSTYAQAYFAINYIAVYSNSTAVNLSTSNAASSNGSSSLRPGSTGEQRSQAAAASSSSRSAGYITYTGPGVGVFAAVFAAVLAGSALVLI